MLLQVTALSPSPLEQAALQMLLGLWLSLPILAAALAMLIAVPVALVVGLLWSALAWCGRALRPRLRLRRLRWPALLSLASLSALSGCGTPPCAVQPATPSSTVLDALPMTPPLPPVLLTPGSTSRTSSATTPRTPAAPP